MINTTEEISQKRFELLYRPEYDTNVKERMLLALNVIYEKQINAQVGRPPPEKQNMDTCRVKKINE